MDSDKAYCSQCDLEFFAPWRQNTINCVNPAKAENQGIGWVYAVACPSCGDRLFEFQDAATSNGERLPLHLDQSTTTLEIIITLVIEFESHRREVSGEGPLTDEEKQEYRERPEIVERARALMDAALASAAGATAANAIAGLLSSGVVG